MLTGLPITLDKFIEETRVELDFMGLPRNCQPTRASLQALYARGFSIRETARYYRSDVKRYEAHVNRGEATPELRP